MRSLNQFKAHINSLGTVKSNRFEVFFVGGPISWPTSPRDLSFRCESLNIPGSQVLTTDFKLYGGQPIVKIPNGRAVDEVQMTFLTAGDMRDKYWFDEWIDKITDLSNNTVSYYNDVASDITIDIFNERTISIEQTESTGTFVDLSGTGPTNRPFRGPSGSELVQIYSVKLIKAIPTRVEAVQVSWADVDQLFKYTVSFSYETLQFLKSSNITKLDYKHLDKLQK
jgi:hypothetical protein